MSYKKTWFVVLLFLVVVFSLSGCTDGAGESTFEKAKKEGYVRIGFANEAPYAYATEEGKVTGLNVEIARAILKELGIDEIVPVVTEFGSLIPGLQAKRFDMITAGAYITPERAKEVAFANPEYQIGGGIAVRAGNPYNITSYFDIADNPEIKVAVMAGGPQDNHMIACGVAEEQIETVPDQPSTIDALIAGRVDVITMTSMALRTYVNTANNPDIEYVEDFEVAVIDGKPQAGFGSSAFRHEDSDFLEAYNQELQKLKDSGKLLEILEQFGFSEAEFPGYITTEELLENW